MSVYRINYNASEERDAAQWKRETADRRAREKGDEERGGREAEMLRATVRADLKAESEAKAAEAAELANMTPAQLAAREHRLQTQIPPPGPGKPDGYFLALEAIRREDAAKEREQQEREQDLPRRRDEWDGKAQAIDAALEDALGEAHEKHREALQAARDRAETERDALGPRPTLQQAVTAS